MKYTDRGVENLKIAYIGGGSRGWAWKLMSDLAAIDDVSGHVDLYDIDYEAAQHNEIIGNKFNNAVYNTGLITSPVVVTVMGNKTYKVLSENPDITFEELIEDIKF